MPFITLCAAIALLAAPLRAADKTPATQKTKLTFTSQEHGFSLSYPPELTKMKAPNKGSMVYLGTKTEKGDAFRESVHVKIEASGLGNATLAQAVKGFEASMKKAGITVLESEPSEINGKPVQRIVYTHPVKLAKGSETVKAVMYFWLRNGTAYGLDVRATETTYDKFQVVGGKVVASLKWTDDDAGDATRQQQTRKD
ncbi:MAG: hypothetical protein ABIP55_12790 [Tepidisphaeraceae bacterium]